MSWGGGWGGGGGGAPAGSGSYTSPTASEIAEWTGISKDIERITQSVFNAFLANLRPLAEARTRLRVTSAVFDSATLTSDQETTLRMAVAFRVGALYLRKAATRKVTGTYEPLDVEEAEQIRAQAAEFDLLASEFDALTLGVDSTDGDSGALPGLITHCFEPSTLTRLPSRRIEILDERDDRIAGAEVD